MPPSCSILPPRTELISLPDHKTIRVLAANDKLRAAVAKLARTPAEFVRADVGNGVQLDLDRVLKEGLERSIRKESKGRGLLDRLFGRN